MKLIHTADWHIGRTLNQFSLLEDQRHFLMQLVDFAVENHVDAILIAGDLYNRAVPSAQAVELLDEAFSQLVVRHGIRVLAIAGNHDSPERLSFCSGMLQSCGLYIAGTPSVRIPYVELNGVVIHLLPYFTAAQIRDLFGDSSIETENDAFARLMKENRPYLDKKKTNILVAHGFYAKLDGGQQDDTIFSHSELSVGALDVMDISNALDYDYVALGHLHAPQRAGGDNIKYAGSPLKYSLSECRQHKSITLLEIGGDKQIAVSERCFDPLHDLHVVEGTFDSLMNNDSNVNPDDYFFANILGDDAVMYAMQKLRTVYPNILGLNFISPQIKHDLAGRIPDARLSDTQTLFKEFYSYVMGEELSEARMNMVRSIIQEQEATADETIIS